MRRWFDLGEVDSELTPSVVAIGVFDGVHRGHQDLISRAKDVATSKGISLIAVTFDPTQEVWLETIHLWHLLPLIFV